MRSALSSLHAAGVDALWVLNDNGLLKDATFLEAAWRGPLATLRVPVVVIKAQAQLLRRLIDHNKADIGAIDEGLGSIVGQTDHLSRLLTLLLDLSRIEAGRLELTPAPMDLRLLISRTIKGMQATTRRHVLQLRAPQQVRGNWDEHRLQEVLENLLANAVKYSPKGGTIGVHVRAGKRSVTVRVSDQGIGLDLDEMPHVFERFYRAKGTRALEGAGLGLYVSGSAGPRSLWL